MRSSVKWSVIVARLVLAVILGSGFVQPDPADATSVAVYGANHTPWNQEVRDRLAATGLFSQVDAYDARYATPTLAELLAYDSVLVYSDYSFSDNVAFGDVLADYMDQGGGVVMATFVFWNQYGLGIKGRVQTLGYLPFTQGSQLSGARLTMIKDLPDDPILLGVQSLDGGSSSYHNSGITTAAGATLIAHWNNGQPLVASKLAGAGRIVGLNFYPPSTVSRSDFWVSTTDGTVLMANALVWASADGCGDGTLVGGEDCDDGNLDAGDCCSPTCEFENTGSACATDGNLCTNDVCDGAGSCAHAPNAVACNDGNACTTGDVCASGQCAAGTLVTTCTGGDACCIPGCTASQDSDCPALEILDYVSHIADDSIDPVNGVNGLYEGRDIAVSPDGTNVYVAAYADSAIGVFDRDLATGAASWIEAEAGANAALTRVNTVAVSPDGLHVYAGNDFFAQSGISLFDRDPVTGSLTYVAVYRQAGLNNVMSMVISADGKNVYASSASNLVVTYSRNAATGVLTSVQTLADGVDGVDGLANARDLAVSADGAHVYVTGTGDHAVAIFSRDASTGLLTFVTALFDDAPGSAFLHRADGVAVSGDGAFVYVSSFDEDLNVFSRDAETGLLTYVRRFPQAGGPGLLTVSPDDGRVYTSSWVIVVDAFGRDVVSGEHIFLQSKRDGVDGVDGLGGVQGIAVSPDGMDVYTGSAYDRALTHFRVRCGDAVLDVGEACDDGNGAGGDGCATNCTVEFCWNCTAVPAALSVCSADEGKPCDDGLYCTGVSGDTCQQGLCTGAPRTCDDSNACTLDSCDETGNACVQDGPVMNGQACDNGAFCTVGESCAAGACQGGHARDCADAEDCTTDSCNEAGDECVHSSKTDGAVCTSGATCTVGETCTAAVCGDGTLDAVACADHYLCYKAKTTSQTTGFEGILALPLADSLQTSAADVRKPGHLCTPASKDGAAIRDGITHLEGYSIKTAKAEPKFVPQVGLTVTDRYGSLVVDTVKPKELLVPSTKATSEAAAPLPSSSNVDHYRCFQVKLTSAFPSGLQATLHDAFMAGPLLYDVRKPKALCVPTSKDGAGIIEPLAALMCYQVKLAPDQTGPAAVEGQIHTSNAFGQEQLDTKKEDVLCVPALVDPAP